MTRSTGELRQAWGPPCRITPARVILYGGAPITVDYRTKEAFEALSRVLERWDYKADRTQTGAYNCRPITGGTGYSLHAFGIACDINWARNPYGRRLVTDMPAGMVAEIEAIRTAGGAQVFRWGGHYSGNKDAMHYEVVCTPAELAAGIADHKPTPTKPDPARPAYQEDDDMVTLAATSATPPPGAQPNAVYACSGLSRTHLDGAALTAWKSVGTTDLGVNDVWVGLHPNDVADTRLA